MDSGFTLLQTVCQGAFVTVLTVLVLNWIAARLKSVFKTTTNTEPASVNENDEQHEENRQKQLESRQRYQQQHNDKASDYLERILKPREVERRRKKEEEFRKFLGPAWKGDGSVLGGDELDSDPEHDVDVPEGRRAAEKRKIPEQINQEVAASVAAAAAKRQRPKRIITLPDEPGMNEDGVICVMLRTPLGTTCQRRFYSSDKIQCLFDFITTVGFHQRKYTISTSYPRKLIEDPDTCFQEYGFGKRVALNIEERE